MEEMELAVKFLPREDGHRHPPKQTLCASSQLPWAGLPGLRVLAGPGWAQQGLVGPDGAWRGGWLLDSQDGEGPVAGGQGHGVQGGLAAVEQLVVAATGQRAGLCQARGRWEQQQDQQQEPAAALWCTHGGAG